MKGSQIFVTLNSRLESNQEKKRKSRVGDRVWGQGGRVGIQGSEFKVWGEDSGVRSRVQG
jgi:hypothetical protein